jgi:hypothetical protein
MCSVRDSAISVTATIPAPGKTDKRYLLVFYNGTDKTLQSTTVFAGTVLPTQGTNVIAMLVGATAVTYGASGSAGVMFFDESKPNLFALGAIYIQLNLEAATATAGHIHWALYGL